MKCIDCNGYGYHRELIHENGGMMVGYRDFICRKCYGTGRAPIQPPEPWPREAKQPQPRIQPPEPWPRKEDYETKYEQQKGW